jgi:hypothetical protein
VKASDNARKKRVTEQTITYVRPKLLLLMRQHCVASGSSLSTGLSTTIKYVQRTASGAAGNGRIAAGNCLSTGLSTTIKYARRTASGSAGNGLGTMIDYLRYTRNGAAGNGLGTTAKYL